MMRKVKLAETKSVMPPMKTLCTGVAPLKPVLSRDRLILCVKTGSLDCASQCHKC